MNRPQWTRERVVTVAANHGVNTSAAFIIGVRGYFQRSMGAADKNDRGIYDDAIFIVSPRFFRSFNANTDPSRHRTGIAELQTGNWQYKIGKHGINREKETGIPAYKALVQASTVIIQRDGGKRESGYFGINIHRGGNSGTSSLGCQTIVPAQWDEFISSVETELKAMKQNTIVYLLIEGQG